MRGADHPNPPQRDTARGLGGMQNPIAACLASGGVLLDYPEPARFFEVLAAKPLPETLNYVH